MAAETEDALWNRDVMTVNLWCIILAILAPGETNATNEAFQGANAAPGESSPCPFENRRAPRSQGGIRIPICRVQAELAALVANRIISGAVSLSCHRRSNFEH